MLMETFKKVNGKTVKLMGMVSIFIKMAASISEIGRMIVKMVKVVKLGLMATATKERIKKA